MYNFLIDIFNTLILVRINQTKEQRTIQFDNDEGQNYTQYNGNGKNKKLNGTMESLR